MGGEEATNVAEAFTSNWIAPVGPHIHAFEQQIAKYVGTEGCVAVNSGTAAIHLALQVLNVQPNDVVLCQSFTFAATAFPIVYCEAKPIFIDSETDTWNMDPVLLKQCIEDCLQKGTKPKAIIVVHLYGMPAKMHAIMSIANQYNIPVIEDAAEALGSQYENHQCGSLGNIGIFSFNGNKIITTSGGGALVSNNTYWLQKAAYLATQAKDATPFYQHQTIGFNYKLSNVLAGIGCGQMQVLNDRIYSRRNIYHQYQMALANDERIAFLNEPANCYSNRWLTTILLPSAVSGANEAIRKTLAAQKIECRLLWKPLHEQPVFQSYQRYTNGVSNQLFERGLCLPSGSNLSESQFSYIIYAFKKALDAVC